MDNFGNFAKQYVKQVVVRDADDKEVMITLKYSARTPLLYMNMYGTDMFNDLAKVVEASSKKSAIIDKINERGIASLSENELNSLELGELFEFYDKFAVALIATALMPKPYSYEIIRSTMLPDDFITDERYEDIFKAIEELFVPVLVDYKKKLQRISGVTKK